jgi:hypothetical protein
MEPLLAIFRKSLASAGRGGTSSEPLNVHIRAELDLLSQFPALHQRTKLAIYCSKTSTSYLLCVIPLDLSYALMPF